MNIHFYKYHGAGNDFIILDNREHGLDLIKDSHTIAALCHRRFGIGADGLMLIERGSDTTILSLAPGIEPDSSADFNMVYYNADGGLGSMCGNGGRCIVALAHRLGIINNTTTFNASDGDHIARLINTDYVELKMNPVHTLDMYADHAVLDTGSPHYIQIVDDVHNYPVFNKGQLIRYSAEFPQGINVNYIEPNADDLNIRTYERGVEDETWACGTGAVAAALAYIEMSKKYELHEVQLEAKGGRLKVKFDRIGPGHFENIWLCGGATFIYEGNFTL